MRYEGKSQIKKEKKNVYRETIDRLSSKFIR